MKKRIVVGGIVVMGVVSLGLALWPSPEPPEDLAERSPGETADYLASRAFRNLDEDQKIKVMSEVVERGATNGLHPRAMFASVDEDQRDQLRENVRPVMRQVMMARVTQYFELPAAQRVAYLDKMLEEGQGRMGRPGPGGGPAGGGSRGDGPPGERRPDGGDGERRGPSPERMKGRLESTAPADRARMQEFFKDLRERAEQRGLPPPQRGPRP